MSKTKIVFLDRDGVINKFPGNGNYVTKVKDFRFIPGTLEAIKQLTDAGYVLFIISNQAGVGKGVYSRDTLKRITKKMLSKIKKNGGRIKKVFYCTHRSDDGCDCRKPEILFIKKGLATINKSIAYARNTFFVGDTVTDMVAGQNAGCKTIFVLSGRSDRSRLRYKKVKPDYIAKDLFAASKIILNGRE